MLKLFNSGSRTKETFTPIEPGKVRMYVCGMTVYDYCHLGHARVLVVFDVIVRHLRQLGYEVTYVRNITDIDDKIIARAKQNGESVNALTERFVQAMHEDADALGVLRPDAEPRATDSIADILGMIRKLVDSGYAYQGGNGDVFYSVNKFPGYGKLSGKRVEELRSGERVEVDEAKRDPLDFVLWKMAKPEEPAWPSDWGNGRPGWHIECSAMSTECLGARFDIHGGGMDLQFPHHENEIAQSEAATGEHFVNYWIHNGFVQVDEEKMSKSLGNFFTVREILQRYQPEEVRYFILSSHYRSPLHYSDDNLDKARGALQRLYTALRDSALAGDAPDSDYEARFQASMDDDFNTPEALAVLFELARGVNRAREQGDAAEAQLANTLRLLAGRLGILQSDPDTYLRSGQGESAAGPGDAEIDTLVALRDQARIDKDWAEADRLRDQLAGLGIALEDASNGTLWRRD
ncbi:Cysteinyl-tRNA synthetase [hydrothermal vent metagenome]|uniref:Cysteine--tRNA ligase n=1 Tax=hydrothermal vent metagenome TaxID=652676 RepID=A0A3B0Z5W6_9ZZZZ